jgi:hypothetical protein
VALVLLALWSQLPRLGAWLAQWLLVLRWSLAGLSLLGLLVLVGRALGQDQTRFLWFSQAIAVVGGGVGWCLLSVLVSQSFSAGQQPLVAGAFAILGLGIVVFLVLYARWTVPARQG